MEKSVKNAVFKGFPVLMESDTFGSKQNSQTTNKETNNSLSSFFRVYYLVSKCMGKRVADQSAIDTALVWLLKLYNTRGICADLWQKWTYFIHDSNTELCTFLE